jgi:hypothetical protein
LDRAPPPFAGGHPPAAVRLDTRISDMATKVRTAAPFLLRTEFIGIAAIRVKPNTAGFWRGGRRIASNVRLKSAGRAKPAAALISACHSTAAIWQRGGPQIARACC